MSLLRSAARRSLLLDFRFGLVRRSLLLFQSFGSARISRRSRNFPILLPVIGSLRQAAGSLFLRKLIHSTSELLAEMIVHFLQIVERHGHLFADATIIFLTGQNFHIDVLVIIRRVGHSADDVTV